MLIDQSFFSSPSLEYSFILSWTSVASSFNWVFISLACFETVSVNFWKKRKVNFIPRKILFHFHHTLKFSLVKACLKLSWRSPKTFSAWLRKLWSVVVSTAAMSRGKRAAHVIWNHAQNLSNWDDCDNWMGHPMRLGAYILRIKSVPIIRSKSKKTNFFSMKLVSVNIISSTFNFR